MLGNHNGRPARAGGRSDFPSILGGFPHSEIHGSKGIRTSPWLIAAYHVLHRLCMPRHPPIALKTLDRSHCQCPPGSLPTVLARKTSFSRSVRWPAVKPPIICRGLSVPGDEPPVAVEPEQIFSSRCRQNRRMARSRPRTFASRRMTRLPSFHRYGGAGRDRTDDPLLAKQVLSQLSYGP
jgi:hypothetical protein